MKNKEKYPNTNDALKAFAEHNKHCNCGCTFEEWLDREDTPSGIGKSIAGMILGSLMLGELVDDLRRAAKEEASAKHSDPKPEKPSVDKLTGVECPICHGKNATVQKIICPFFECPDCGSYIGITNSLSDKEPNLRNDTKAFTSFIADLCTKNNAKA